MAKVEILPFRAWHFDVLDLQQAQLSEVVMTGEQLEARCEAYTLLVDDVPLAVAGVAVIYPGRAIAMAFLSEMEIGALHVFTKAIRAFLEDREERRIETTVRRDWDAAHRWARLLGFENETETGPGLRAYAPDGSTCDVYARIRQ